MFSVHATPEKYKKTTITGFALEENTVSEITWLSWRYLFWKAPSSKYFSWTRKRTAVVFKFLRFEERFRKVWFRMEGLTVENKTAFPNFSGVVWTLEFLACYHSHLHYNMIWFWSSLAVEASHGVRNLKPASMWCHSSGETCSRR